MTQHRLRCPEHLRDLLCDLKCFHNCESEKKESSQWRFHRCTFISWRLFTLWISSLICSKFRKAFAYFAFAWATDSSSFFTLCFCFSISWLWSAFCSKYGLEQFLRVKKSTNFYRGDQTSRCNLGKFCFWIFVLAMPLRRPGWAWGPPYLNALVLPTQKRSVLFARLC